MRKTLTAASAAAFAVTGALAVAPAAATPTTATPSEKVAPATVRTYQASWSRTWRNGRVRTDTTDLVQGTAAGGRNTAQVGFPATLCTDLRAAQTVNPATRIAKVEVYAKNSHWWYYSGGKVDVGVHGRSTPTTAFTYSGSLTYPAAASARWTVGTGNWVTLPATWLPGFNSCTSKGFTLGGKANASLLWYGRFNGATAATGKPAIRVTYDAPPAPAE